MSSMTNARKFVDALHADAVGAWFRQFGSTDEGYLRAHFDRFLATHLWVNASASNSLQILDVGAHWLHHAFFYANDGHHVTCVDGGVTLQRPSVIAAASAMGVERIWCSNLERMNELRSLASETYDVLLFCEIIEHLTFNPIRMWKEIYRVMKNGARIIVTTPNSYYGPHLSSEYHRLTTGRGMGITLGELFEYGTFGHHWKEYSVDELKDYFSLLSSDFVVTRCETKLINGHSVSERADIEAQLSEVVNVTDNCIFMEITVNKSSGILTSAPWEID